MNEESITDILYLLLETFHHTNNILYVQELNEEAREEILMNNEIAMKIIRNIIQDEREMEIN